MTGAAIRLALAGALTIGLAAPVSAAPTTRDAYVAVSVATVWTTSQSPRSVDKPALQMHINV